MIKSKIKKGTVFTKESRQTAKEQLKLIFFRRFTSKTECLHALLAPFLKPLSYLILALLLAVKFLATISLASLSLAKLKPVLAYDYFLIAIIYLGGSFAFLAITALSPLWISAIFLGRLTGTLLSRCDLQHCTGKS